MASNTSTSTITTYMTKYTLLFVILDARSIGWNSRTKYVYLVNRWLSLIEPYRYYL